MADLVLKHVRGTQDRDFRPVEDWLHSQPDQNNASRELAQLARQAELRKIWVLQTADRVGEYAGITALFHYQHGNYVEAGASRIEKPWRGFQAEVSPTDDEYKTHRIFHALRAAELLLDNFVPPHKQLLLPRYFGVVHDDDAADTSRTNILDAGFITWPSPSALMLAERDQHLEGATPLGVGKDYFELPPFPNLISLANELLTLAQENDPSWDCNTRGKAPRIPMWRPERDAAKKPTGNKETTGLILAVDCLLGQAPELRELIERYSS